MFTTQNQSDHVHDLIPTRRYNQWEWVRTLLQLLHPTCSPTIDRTWCHPVRSVENQEGGLHSQTDGNIQNHKRSHTFYSASHSSTCFLLLTLAPVNACDHPCTHSSTCSWSLHSLQCSLLLHLCSSLHSLQCMLLLLSLTPVYAPPVPCTHSSACSCFSFHSLQCILLLLLSHRCQSERWTSVYKSSRYRVRV